MNFRPNKKEAVNVDITPLIDVVFLLLIFFMVSTSFSHTSQLNISLPTASKEATETEPKKINIDLTANGTIYINDSALANNEVETIKTALAAALTKLNQEEAPPIIINADAQATHQLVVRIMDAARQLDLVKLTFATQEIPTQ